MEIKDKIVQWLSSLFEKRDKQSKERPAKLDRRAFLMSWLRTLLLATAIVTVVIIGTVIALGRFTRHTEKFELPDFKDMSIAEAKIFSDTMNLRFEILDSLYVESAAPGVILEQYPRPGSHVKSGRRVTVTTSTVAPRSVTIPYVTGYSLRQAQNTLSRVGIGVEKLIYVEDIATNNILKQEYKGEVVNSDSKLVVPIYSNVVLYVGLAKGAPMLPVPSVMNKDLRTVKGDLTKEGFNIIIERDNTINSESLWNSVVYTQNPLPGDSISYGADIKLYITKDTDKAKHFLKQYTTLLDVIKSVKTEYDEITNEIANDSITVINDDGIMSLDEFSYSDSTGYVNRSDYAIFETVNRSDRHRSVKSMLDSLEVEKINLSNGVLKFND